MKNLVLILFLSVCFLLDTMGQNKEEEIRPILWHTAKNTKSPESIKGLILMTEVMGSSSIPNKIRQFNNLEILDLSSAQGSAKPADGRACTPIYSCSRLKYLPGWIGELDKIKKIDLIGAYHMNYAEELPKISSLPNLEYLRISPSILNEPLVQVLSRFTQIKKLCIMPGKIVDNAVWVQQLNTLRTALPDCIVDVC